MYSTQDLGLNRQIPTAAKEVFCTNHTKYDDWMIQTTVKARNLNVWQYISGVAELSSKTPLSTPYSDDGPMNTEPERPQRPDQPATPTINVTQPEWEIFERRAKVYAVDLEIYKQQLAEFKEFERNKHQFKEYLSRTIPIMYVELLLQQEDSMAAWISYIRSKLSPSNEIRLLQLDDEFQELMKGPKGEDFERYLSRWNRLYMKMDQSNHRGSHNLLQDFYRMIEDKIDVQEGRLIAELSTDFDSAVDRLRNFYRRRPGNFKRRVDTYATFTGNGQRQLMSPDVQQQRPNSAAKQQKAQGPDCSKWTGATGSDVCQRIQDCPIARWRKRPKEADMTPTQQKKFQFYQQKLRSSVKLAEKQAGFGDPVAISICKELKQPQQNLTAEPYSSYGESSSIQANAIRITPRMVMNHQAALKTTDMWMLDGGSNTHIINNPTRSSFQAESIPSEIEIYAGNGTIKAVARGTAQLEVRSTAGKLIKVVLKNVLYVPGFHTNIVASSLTREIGLFLDERTDIWYDSRGAEVTKLLRHDKLPYLNCSSPAAQPNLRLIAWPVDEKGCPLPISSF